MPNPPECCQNPFRQKVVARMVHNPEHPLAGLQERNIQGPPAKIEDQPQTGRILPPSCGNGASNRFLDQENLLQAGNPACPCGSVILWKFESAGVEITAALGAKPSVSELHRKEAT